MLALCVSFIITVIDQTTKYLITLILRHGDYVSIFPGFYDLRYVQNTGAAFGIFHGFNNGLVVMSVAMLLLIVVFRRVFLPDTLLHRIVMGLMVGGIAGNLIDRLKFGYVVDFLDFHWGVHSFPAFNIADSSICAGVGLYILLQVIPVKSDKCTPEQITEAANNTDKQ
jgi:signal peptidase II